MHKPMTGTRKLCFMAVLTAISLTLFVLEAQLPPPLPVPGVKYGIANIITLSSMLLLGRREAGEILLVRILMSVMFAGSPSTLLFSIAGGGCAYLVMCVLTKLMDESLLWVVSALSGVAHNAGQLLMCMLIVKTPGVLAYIPVLAVSGIVTGVFTGIAARQLVRALKKYKAQ